MKSLKELCIEKSLALTQIMKMIVRAKEPQLLLQLSTKVDGLSRNGFLLLEKQFEVQIEMACRHEEDLNVSVEVIFSSDIYMDGNVTYFKPSNLHPQHYCNIRCVDETISIEDLLLFQFGGDANATTEDKVRSGDNKLKAKTLSVTPDLLYVASFDQIMNLAQGSTELELPFGLSQDDIRACLDLKHPHFNPGIPLSIVQWCKNNRENRFDDIAKENKTTMATTIQDLINSQLLNARPKSGIITAAAALSVSGSVTRGRPKNK